MNRSIFSHAQSSTLLQVFIISPQVEAENYSSPTAFSEDLFFPSRRAEGEDYGVEKITKIQPIRLLVRIFDKFQAYCNFYIFGFCLFVP